MLTNLLLKATYYPALQNDWIDIVRDTSPLYAWTGSEDGLLDVKRAMAGRCHLSKSLRFSDTGRLLVTSAE